MNCDFRSVFFYNPERMFYTLPPRYLDFNFAIDHEEILDASQLRMVCCGVEDEAHLYRWTIFRLEIPSPGSLSPESYKTQVDPAIPLLGAYPRECS